MSKNVVRWRALAVIATAAGLTQCSNPAVPCFDLPVAAFAIHAKSSVTGELLDSLGRLTITHLDPPGGSFTGPFGTEASPGAAIAATKDHTGRFAIQIVVPGFETWQDTVTVRKNEANRCPHPETVTIIAQLIPKRS